jgi:cysteine-rich repeat protein
MNAGEQWHFHVRVQGTGMPDPAIYVLPGCDERSCAGGLDECGATRDEHLSFRAAASREYLVGIDSAQPGGARYELIALRAECGNNIREHGESCEDGNRNPGDGCDERCRAELSGPEALEVEPNDDFTDPNVLLIPSAGGTLTVQGRLGGRCDFDMFAVTVPAGASVRATMLDVNGMPCGMLEPSYRMAWVLPDGRTEGGLGVARMDNRCPSITEAEAFSQRVSTEGQYFLRVTTARDEANGRNYRMRVELLPP